MVLLRLVAHLLAAGSPPLPADGSVWDAFKATGDVGGGGHTIPGVTPVSFWGPALLRMNSNKTILFVEADRATEGHDGYIAFATSDDDGRTWGAPTTAPGQNGMVYVASTNTILLLTGPPANGQQPEAHTFRAGKCDGHDSSWGYDDDTGRLTASWLGPPSLDTTLGLESCKPGTRCDAPVIAVGMERNGTGACANHEAAAFGWDFSTAGQIVHRLSGQCLTIPERKTAVLTKCEPHGEGQQFVRSSSTGAAVAGAGMKIKLAPGMYRAGECLVPSPGDPPPPPMPPRVHSADRAGGEVAGVRPCEAAMLARCNSSRLRDPEHGYPACEACLKANTAALRSVCASADGGLKNPNLHTFCGGCVAEGGCGLGPSTDLQKGPQPCGTESGIVKSTDEGKSWSKYEPIRINQSWATHAGGGLAHGIEMVQNGPHKGRLALARHFDCDPNGDPPELHRDFVLYSDNKGETWEAGELLPMGWTETQLTELKNGSLLLTSRTGYAYITAGLRRGFARSDVSSSTLPPPLPSPLRPRLRELTFCCTPYRSTRRTGARLGRRRGCLRTGSRTSTLAPAIRR
eukprot:COSAG06_NODE_5373_length_3517_cov_14.089819_1_plen_573_part_00